MKSIKLFIATACMALFFVGCNETKVEEKTVENKIEEKASNKLKVEMLKYNEKNDFAQYDIVLPQIANVDSEDISYFNDNMKESLRYIVENMSTSNEDTLIKTADITYANYPNTFGVLSIEISASLSNGGAHPENVIDTYNINLKDNTLLSFGKVFNEDDVNYFNMLINDRIKAGKVKNTQGKEVALFSNVEADIRNAGFYFEGDSVAFVFQQYVLGPYASGMPVFKFNRSEIKDHLQLNK